MIRISKKQDKYFIDGKEVTDELEFPIKQRLMLLDFKSDIEEKKIKIKSRIYTV